MKSSKILHAIALVAFGLMASAPLALPAERAATWACTLNVSGEAYGGKIIVDKAGVEGRGVILCANQDSGVREILPVKVSLKTKALGADFDFTIGKMRAIMESQAEISLFENAPEDLLGTYVATEARSAIFAGAGVFTAVRVGIPAISIKLGLQLVKGFGLHFSVKTLLIELDEGAETGPQSLAPAQG